MKKDSKLLPLRFSDVLPIINHLNDTKPIIAKLDAKT